MTYIFQVIALWLASHKHLYAQATASGKSSIMNLHLVHIHTYMAKVHMNMHAGLCVCVYSCFAFTPSSFLSHKHPLEVQSTFVPFPQDGWTAVLLAACCGHKEVVQELCETFGADFLHRKKVRAMQTMSGSEWLSEL